jgi:hypothetical protein
MEQSTAIKIASILFAGSPPDGLPPARVDPRVMAAADTDRSGTLSLDEVISALVADRLQVDTATDRLVPAIPLALVPVQPLAERMDLAGPKVTVSAQPLQLTLIHPDTETGPGRNLLAVSPAEPLMMAPTMGRAPSATITAGGIDLTAPIVPDGSVRLGMHVDTDPTKPRQQGSMLLEESHPHYLEWHNVAGSGLTVGMDSRTRIQFAGSQQASELAIGQTPDAMSANVRHEERLHVERPFAVFGPAPDTTLQAGYLVGVGPWQWGGPLTTAPVGHLTQYATVSVSTRPLALLGLNAEVYLPIQNGAGARGAHPLARLTASLPHVTVGTTQSADTARYDVSVAVEAPLGMQVAASSAIDYNRVTERTGFSTGLQIRMPW